MLRLLTFSALLLMTACSKQEVADVSLGLLTTKDIKVQSFTDPAIAGITCHISHIEADLDFADPSDMSISCRQTGPVTANMLAGIDRSKNGEVIFTKSKSILFKNLKIRRVFDAKNQTLLYLSYSTKETSGSYKHALSTVPLWNTEAWQAPLNNTENR